jgi:hypothetical protein
MSGDREFGHPVALGYCVEQSVKRLVQYRAPICFVKRRRLGSVGRFLFFRALRRVDRKSLAILFRLRGFPLRLDHFHRKTLGPCNDAKHYSKSGI